MSWVRDLAGKATLRGYVVFLTTTVFTGLVTYIVVRSDVKLSVSGSLDINTLIVAFVALINTSMSWLFLKRKTGD